MTIELKWLTAHTRFQIICSEQDMVGRLFKCYVVGCSQRASSRSVRGGDHSGRAGLAGRGAPGPAAAPRARHHLH